MFVSRPQCLRLATPEFSPSVLLDPLWCRPVLAEELPEGLNEIDLPPYLTHAHAKLLISSDLHNEIEFPDLESAVDSPVQRLAIDHGSDVALGPQDVGATLERIREAPGVMRRH
jgi:hypothetical protein